MAIHLLTYKIFDTADYEDVSINAEKYTLEALSNDNKSFAIEKAEDGVMQEPMELYTGNWAFPIRVKRTISLSNANQLYGEMGLVPNDAAIGLCVIWTSTDSMQRGTYDLGIVKNVETLQTFTLDGTFELKSSLAGKVQFRMCFYLRQESPNNTPYQAKIQGTLLGDIDYDSFLFDGSVIFPIVSVHNTKEQPLWDVECNWVDINDSFMGTVRICLNEDHDLYKYIDQTKDCYDKNLVREILAGALLQIIQKYSESDPDFTQFDSAEPESVADYVRLYIKGWSIKDYSSFNSISRELRKRLEEKF